MTQNALAIDRSARTAVSHQAPAERLSVELTRSLDLRPEDSATLERLIDERPSVGVFVSTPWLSGFFHEPPAGFDPALLLLREGAQLRGVVPVAIRPTLTHTRITLLGGGFGSDRVDLLAARGFEAVAADAFLVWLDRTFGAKGFLLELRDVPAESALWGAIQRAGLERTLRLALQPREIFTLPYLDLSEASRVELNEAPSARTLQSLAKHRRWLERKCRLRIDLLDSVGDVMTAFDSLGGFLRARWQGQEHGSVLDDPRLRRFHERALPRLLSAGRLRMIRLSGDDRTIGVFYGIAAGRWWGYYLAGYDRAWSGRIHLGQLTLAAAIDLAAREGAAEFDFLKGAERIKYSWPVRERIALDADVFSERTGAQLTRATRATRDAAAALTKSARDLFSA